jgi:hypothetical protein
MKLVWGFSGFGFSNEIGIIDFNGGKSLLLGIKVRFPCYKKDENGSFSLSISLPQ